MKFAKELEDDLVPEWRAKYLDYRAGKKKLNAVARALRAVNSTPRVKKRSSPEINAPVSTFGIGHDPSSSNAVPPPTLPTPRESAAKPLHNAVSLGRDLRAHTGTSPSEGDGFWQSPSMSIPPRSHSIHGQADEHEPLRGDDNKVNYGSFIPTPPRHLHRGSLASLELPDPALDPVDVAHGGPRLHRASAKNRSGKDRPQGRDQQSKNAYEIGKTQAPSSAGSKTSPRGAFFRHRRTFSQPDGSLPRPFIHRILTTGGSLSKKRGDIAPNHRDVPLEAYRDFDMRQAEFFRFLDSELEKIEKFYQEKEDQANVRLELLREQLHEMRNRRLQEVVEAQRSAHKHRVENELDRLLSSNQRRSEDVAIGGPRSASHYWFRPFESAMGSKAKVLPGTRFGKTTKAMQHLGSPASPMTLDNSPRHVDHNQDFVRRHNPQEEVPYRQAKRKLKMALAEYYRGLELLKSYALLNRTAFRKINKKYDKSLHARPTGRYMTEKVNNAWFVQSGTLDGHLQTVEDLYARYFERGNHKIAVGKLRRKGPRAGEHYASVWRNGLLLGAGLVFGVQAIVYGEETLHDPDPVVRIKASYLLQIYAGYFLALFLFLLFTLACRVWTVAKINYAFIFEFDTRDSLDWRQLAEIPCFLLGLEGVIMWLNFQKSTPRSMFIYWPVILIGITVLLLFFPAKTLYHRSRGWFLYSNWRLLLAGIYPVEFRDFFLGDMFCSLTYAMGNFELFFCLYANHWTNPPQCNSSHSRLLGFFTCLPGIWRALQCLRRYYNTRNVFPHLVNGGKYTFTILYYMSLSLYRIDESSGLKALFIFCATINAIYCSLWDLAMDWSLLNPYTTPHPFLRETLGYKSVWPYYLAIGIDPILRFNWIPYAIYTGGLQHSAGLSFFVGLTEVMRRGMWVLFRVENEHCTNVGRFRASRDVPLPYDLPTPSTISSPSSSPTTAPQPASHPSSTSPTTTRQKTESRSQHLSPSATRPKSHRQNSTPVQHVPDLDLEASFSPHAPDRAFTDLAPHPSHTSASLRQRRGRSSSDARLEAQSTPISRGIARVGTLITSAHAEDFQRRLPPLALGSHQGGESSEEEEDEDEEDEAEVREEGRARDGKESEAERQQSHGSGGGRRRTSDRAVEGSNARDIRQAEDLLEAAGEHVGREDATH